MRVHEQHGEAIPAWATKTLGDDLSHIWLDTHTLDRQGLSFVMAEAGDNVIVLGGDYP
jgi:hypothetical protein